MTLILAFGGGGSRISSLRLAKATQRHLVYGVAVIRESVLICYHELYAVYEQSAQSAHAKTQAHSEKNENPGSALQSYYLGCFPTGHIHAGWNRCSPSHQ